MMYIHPVEYQGISIHSLRVEGDNTASTPALRRTISIHSLRVEGDIYGVGGNVDVNISIHSLRVEGDDAIDTMRRLIDPFQSTPSVWRETATYTGEREKAKFQSTPSVWRETELRPPGGSR